MEQPLFRIVAEGKSYYIFGGAGTVGIGTEMSIAVEMNSLQSSGPVTLTIRAAEEIRNIMSNKDIPEEYHLRVGAKGGGCSGMSYILGFDHKRDFDVQFDIEGITVFMDKRQGLYLMGTVVDYQDGLDARGFTFENPNATATCGCGSSFSA